MDGGNKDPIIVSTKNKYTIQLLLILSFLFAFIVRLSIIGKYGFSEDEIRKLLAVHSYSDLNFSDNAAHPFLNKGLIFLSISIFGETEFAVRLPNAIIASLTVYPIFYLGKKVHSEQVGIIAAFLWAVDISSIAFTTVAKEDTLLVFFWICALYFYLEALDDRSYLTYCGISVGLAWASKYSAYLLVILLFILLYFDHRSGTTNLEVKEILRRACIPALVVFLIFNFPILIPRTIENLWNHQVLNFRDYPDKSGYIMMGVIMRERPKYYLILFLAVKTPVIELVFFIIGLYHFKAPLNQSKRLLLISFILPLGILTLLDGFTRYILVALPQFLIILAIGIYNFSKILARERDGQTKLENRIFKLTFSISFTTILAILIIGLTVTPYYRMYVNEIGGGQSKYGYYFPQDSVYDYKIKEGMQFLNQLANPNALIAMSVPIVGKYYGRSDFQFMYIRELSKNTTQWKESGVDYIMIQESRIYFENQVQITLIRANFLLIQSYSVINNVVVEIYQVPWMVI